MLFFVRCLLSVVVVCCQVFVIGSLLCVVCCAVCVVCCSLVGCSLLLVWCSLFVVCWVSVLSVLCGCCLLAVDWFVVVVLC